MEPSYLKRAKVMCRDMKDPVLGTGHWGGLQTWSLECAVARLRSGFKFQLKPLSSFERITELLFISVPESVWNGQQTPLFLLLVCHTYMGKACPLLQVPQQTLGFHLQLKCTSITCHSVYLSRLLWHWALLDLSLWAGQGCVWSFPSCRLGGLAVTLSHQVNAVVSLQSYMEATQAGERLIHPSLSCLCTALLTAGTWYSL